jgi:hypothetical protein
MPHPMACRCGAVRGVVETDGRALHIICYCLDCQAYARFLQRSPDLLDARGGSEAVLAVPKNLTFIQGLDRLACVRMTNKGPLRWYAACCDTPIGNTALTPKVAFVGLQAACLETSGKPLAESFGPIRMWNHTAGARGEPKPVQTPIARLIGHIVRRTLGARLDGSYRRTPFFDLATGKPIAEPRVLSRFDRVGLDTDPPVSTSTTG